VAVDREMVARTISELRAALPEADDLLVGLLRVAEATRTVLEVDGAGLTLAHEDGPPRWVATTDRAMELLEQIQQDFGEGPCLAAYSEDRVVAVEDLRWAPRWDRIAAVVGQLQVRGMVSVPVRLAGQPVGTLNAYTTNPRAWSAQEIDALGGVGGRDRRPGPHRSGARQPRGRGGPAAAGAGQPGLDRAGQGRAWRLPGDQP
jgi:GAF domain-containing protein